MLPGMMPSCPALALTAPLRVTYTSSPKWCSRLTQLWWQFTASTWLWKLLWSTVFAASITRFIITSRLMAANFCAQPTART
jgi:hypothetical protein